MNGVRETFLLTSLSLLSGSLSLYLGEGLTWDWLVTSGRMDFVNAGGSILLALTDLNVLLPSIGLLILGALQALAAIIILSGLIRKWELCQ